VVGPEMSDIIVRTVYVLRLLKLRIQMSEFKIEAVGGKRVKKHPMPSAEKVAETLKAIWSICWDKQSDWTPFGEFSFRERTHQTRYFE